jgi:hypothetical protein
MTQIELNSTERRLLQWLGEAPFSPYGGCYGSALDALMAKGLAELVSDEEVQSSAPSCFIAKGQGLMYRAVRLTDSGRAQL